MDDKSVLSTRAFLQQALACLERNEGSSPQPLSRSSQPLTAAQNRPHSGSPFSQQTSRSLFPRPFDPTCTRNQHNSTTRAARIRQPWKKKSKKVKLSMWEHEFICLAHCNQSNPPTALEKVDLIRAGLGPKKIPMFDFGESWEFHEELLAAFPKLANGGGYELLRTMPQNNKEFFVIPPDRGGYTVQYLKRVVSQAKIYVRPMQKDLDLTPLLPEKDQMGLAPTEQCIQCGESVPLHQLRDHLDQCIVNLERNNGADSMAQSNQQTDSQFSCHLSSDPDPDSPLTPPQTRKQRSPTPPTFSPITPTPESNRSVCSNHALPLHVDLTLEEDILDAVIEESLQSQSVEPQNLKDIIKMLQNTNSLMIPLTDNDWDAAPRCTIDVRRHYVTSDALREARGKRFDHTKLLRVMFVGEAGVDTGGPSREFWRLLCSGVVQAYCMKNANGKHFFMKNVPALQREDFKHFGKLVAMSIIQGGPGLPIFDDSVYNYMATNTYLGQVYEDAVVPDAEVRVLLSKIDGVSTTDELRFLFSEDNPDKGNNDTLVYETGFRRALCLLELSQKKELKSALQDYNTIIKTKAEIDQFCNGLDLLGVLECIKKYKDLMMPCFVPQPNTLSKDFFRSFLSPHFSENTQKKAQEEQTFIFFMQFIDECEDETVYTEHLEQPVQVTLEDILIFFTGASQEPHIGFSEQASLLFHDKDLATASTCDLKLRLPRKHQTYEEFRSWFILALKGNDGLGVA